MEFTVSSGGAVCGTLTAEREGLYWCIRAHCRAMPGVVRLHGCAPDGTRQPLGVLLPEDGMLCLRRRLSASALPLTEAWRFTTDECELVTVGGIAVPNGTVEQQGSARRLYVPFDAHTPFCLMEYVCFFTLARRNGRAYWTCILDEKNTPILVDNPPKCDTISQVS